MKVPIVLTPNEYVGKVSEQLLVDIIVFASITDTETNLIEKETFRFRTPDLIMNVPDEVKVGQPTSVTASFRNPLDQWLTSVEWFVEGAGLTKPLTIDERCVGVNQGLLVCFILHDIVSSKLFWRFLFILLKCRLSA